MISELKRKAMRGEAAGRRKRGLARAARLGIAAAAVLISAVLPLQAQTETVRAAADSSKKALADLPPAVLPVISSVLGRDDAQYGMQKTAGGYSAQNGANHLVAHYAAKGVEIRSQNADWGFEFQGWGYGEHPANKNKAAIAPSVNANRVEYRRGALTEWYVNGPLGIEQGFTISQPPVALPDSNHDALDIALRLRGNLSASIESGRHALTLRNQRGVETLRYGPLLVYDASGRELESWMEVQDGSLRLRVNTVGARYPIIVDPWVQAAELTNSLGLAGDGLGRAIAIDEAGDTVVVGAPYATISGNASQGAAYVFVEPTNGWATTGTYTAELINNSGAAGDNFGWSVAISGNTIVVGAPSATNMNQGAAYVFVEPTSGGWITPAGSPTYNAQLTPSTGVADDLFGYSVGISGNTVVVGAPQANTSLGEAYVFVESTWSGSLTSNIELTASNGVAGDLFGYSAGINESANTIVVGAPGVAFGPNPNTSQGAAYVFVEPTSGGWATPTTYVTFNAELFASDGATGDSLGYSVGISGNTVVAGAPKAKIGLNTAQGAAYVFVEPVGGWLLSEYDDAKLNASSGTSSTSLGNSVGISGNTVIAGAQGVSIGSNSATGAAYVFVEPTATGGWASAPAENETAELTASVGVSEAFLGYSVGISGNTVVAGAPGVSFGSNPTQGAAYVFTQAGGSGPYAQYSPTQMNFGNVADNVPASQTVTVTNTGSQPLIIQLVIPSADGTIFTVTQSTCNGVVASPPAYPITISPTSACVFAMQFDPTAPGAVNVQLGFEDNAGVGESNLSSTQSGSNFLQSMPLSGTGVVAAATTTTITSTSSKYQGIATLQAGFALVGNPVTANFTVVPQAGGSGTPTGTVTVTDGSGDSCSNSVAAGSCMLTFANPGTFTLTATYVPDPASQGLFAGSSFTYQNQETVLQLVVCGGFTTITGNKTVKVDANVCVASDVNSNPTAQALTCLQNATCTISITQTDPGVYSLELIVLIKAVGGATRVNPPPAARLWPLTLFWFGSLLATVMMLHVAQRGRAHVRRSWTVASLLIVMILIGALSACSTGRETPPGSYIVNVQFKDGNFNIVVPFPVVVKK